MKLQACHNMGRLFLHILLVLTLGEIFTTIPTFTHALNDTINGRMEIFDDHSLEEPNGIDFCTSESDAQLLGRNGVTNPLRLWTNTSFVYKVDPKLPLFLILEVVDFFKQELRCVSFRYIPWRVSYTKPHVIFVPSKPGDCASYVGRYGNKQNINLGKGCVYAKGIAHEVLHALGLDHEHKRPDRGQYVIINEENIKDGYKGAFAELKMPEYSSFNVPYNFMSVMHYSLKEFSKNNKYTIFPKVLKFNDKLGIGIQPSREMFKLPFDFEVKHKVRYYDLVKLRRMYGCCTGGNCDFLELKNGRISINAWN